MTEIMKIAAVGVIAVLCCIIVKRQAQDIGFVLALVGVAIILTMSLQGVDSILSTVGTLGETAGLSSEIILPVVKTVGIGIIAKTTAEICRDANERGIASMVETGGSIAALLVALPLLQTVLTIILGLI